MYCSSCGKEIANDAVVCVGCGRAVTPAAPPAPGLAELGALKVQETGRSFMVGGILNIIVGLILPFLGWVPGVFSVLVGILELVNASKYSSLPPRSTSNPKWLAVMEIINVITGPIWSLFIGIGNLSRLNSPEVKEYFTVLNNNPQAAALLGRSAGAAVAAGVVTMKNCPQCNNTIPLDDRVCRFCGREYAAEEIAAARKTAVDQAAQAQAQRKAAAYQRMSRLLAVLGWIAVVAGVLLGVLFGVSQAAAGDIGPGTIVTTFVFCPLPLLLVGGGLIFWSKRRASKAE